MGSMNTNKSSNILNQMFSILFEKSDLYTDIFDGDKLNLLKFQQFFYEFQDQFQFLLYEFVPDFNKKELVFGKEFWSDLIELGNAHWINYEKGKVHITMTKKGKKFADLITIIDDPIRQALAELETGSTANVYRTISMG